MGDTSSKSKVVSGMFWKFGERFCAQFVTLVVSIVLARLLDPEHYGAVSVILVFINIANVFVTESFSAALIRKKDADNVDFSTIFYFNIVFSLGLYAVIYFAAPYIEAFYNMPELCNAMRILALKLPISAVYSVQQAYVSRNMLFKKFFFATIVGTAASAAVGICMAYKGFGVYALVGQYLTNSLIGTISLWLAVRWRPIWAFSLEKFKGLFGFGWKILVTALIRTVYEDIYSLVIGKKYTSQDLAFYSKGKQYPQLIISNVNTTITSVMFPALSKHQDSRETVCLMMRRSIKTSSYILCPLLIGMAFVAEPLVSLVLTDKWLPCVPFLRIACFYLLLMPMQSANLQAIKAMGKSGVLLKLEIIKRVSGIIILIFTMQWGVLAIAYGSVLVTLLASFVNSVPNKKMLNYSYWQQLWDIIPNILTALASCAPIYFLKYLNLHNGATFLLQIAVSVPLYIFLSVVTGNDNFKYLWNVAKGMLIRKKG